MLCLLIECRRGSAPGSEIDQRNERIGQIALRSLGVIDCLPHQLGILYLKDIVDQQISTRANTSRIGLRFTLFSTQTISTRAIRQMRIGWFAARLTSFSANGD